MESDLISRRAAIDAVISLCDSCDSSYCGDCRVNFPGVKDARKALEDLPSAQPNLQPTCNKLATDAISRQAAIDALEKWESESTWDEWCYDHKDEAEKYSVISPSSVVSGLPSAQPERTCVNCGRTLNNGGWYADGGTRCPIEEHYALPKDGYCHLWEKRNVTDDDYPERRIDEE